MMQRNPQQNTSSDILRAVREGMDVYDANNQKIGSVETLRFGASTGFDEISQTTNDPTAGQSDSLIENVAEALGGGDDLPDVFQKRLMHEGYIRIDSADLLTPDRFATPDQIAGVRDGNVYLKVTDGMLINEDMADDM